MKKPTRKRHAFTRGVTATATTERRVSFLEMLTMLIRAVREKYNRDPTAAGVILAEVGASGEFYGSVVRYHAQYAQQKEVVVSVQTKTLPEAVQELSKKWLQLGKAEVTLARLFVEKAERDLDPLYVEDKDFNWGHGHE